MAGTLIIIDEDMDAVLVVRGICAGAATDRDHLIRTQLKAISFAADIPTGILQRQQATTAAWTAPNRSLPKFPLVEENMITIDDILRAGPKFVHEGKFLLCRSIMSGARLTALTIVIDDQDGQRCLRVALYNFPGDIRPGTILAILHPCYAMNEDAVATIRVENPQHVRIFNGNESLVRNLGWKAPLPNVRARMSAEDPVSGNDSRSVDDISKMIEAQPANAGLYSDRASAYLRMDEPSMALQDTETGLNLDPSNLQLLYRKGEALISLRRYEEAASFLEKAGKEHKRATKEKSFAELFKSSTRMADESKNGNYDIMAMIDEARRCNLLDNHADYCATAKFEMKEIPGKGRGLVAKEKIEAGTLLMACKAFVFADATEGTLDWVWPITLPTFEPLLQKAIEKLSKNPDLCDDFYNLDAGKELGWLEKGQHSKSVDADRISAIIRLNGFAADDLLATMTTPNSNFKDAGLWIMPSYFNHSCVDCNCFRFAIGDFVFVRAFKDISPGEELLLEYVSPWEPFQKRRQIFDQVFGFECSCRLCQLDRVLPATVHERLNEINEILDESYRRCDQGGSFVPQDVETFKNLLKEARKYRPDQEFNLMADRIQRALAEAMFDTLPAASLQIFEKLFILRKNSGDIHMALFHAVVLARISCSKSKKEVAKWTETAEKLAKVLYGDERVVDLIQQLTKWQD